MSFDPTNMPPMDLDEGDELFMAALERGMDLLAGELVKVPGIGQGVLVTVFEGHYAQEKPGQVFAAICKPATGEAAAAVACEHARTMFARAIRPQG